jgi:hypothetical protein
LRLNEGDRTTMASSMPRSASAFFVSFCKLSSAS